MLLTYDAYKKKLYSSYCRTLISVRGISWIIVEKINLKTSLTELCI